MFAVLWLLLEIKKEMLKTERYSFNTLYTYFYRKSFLFTKSYVHDKCIAEDIVSDTLIKLWEILGEREIEHIEALLFTTLKNKSLDYLKRELIKHEVISCLADMEKRELDIRISTLEACNPEELFSTEVQQIVVDTLALLPEQTRRVFEMSRFENKTNREISVELGITVKGVEYHVTRALKILRENLRDYLYVLCFIFFYW